ncbi:MAG: right-handed parallel beta-helix repeat-containing protein [Candidatus Altiarchaeota archaeon]
MDGKKLIASLALILLSTNHVNAQGCFTPNSTISYLTENTTLCPGHYMNKYIDLTADDITLDCDGAILDVNFSTSGAALDVSSDGTTVKNCIIFNFGKGYQISTTDTNNINDYVINNTFINTSYSSNTGGIISAVLNDNFYILNNTFIGNKNCIQVYAGDNIIIQGNNFTENLFNVISQSGVNTTYLTITENYFTDNLEWSNDMIGLGGQYIHHSSIIDNVFINNNGSAISITGSGSSIKSNITISENIIRNVSHLYSPAIQFTTDLDNSVVSDNVIDVVDGSCIWDGGSSINVSYINNTVSNCNGAGIYLDSSSGSLVENNTLLNNSYGLQLYSYSNLATVRGNTIRDSNTSGINAYSCNNCSFEENNVIYTIRDGFYIGASSNDTVVFDNLFCYSDLEELFGQDIDNHGGAGTTGWNNTCDTYYSWNDEGTTGCTYPCATTTTSTSTTSTSTTSSSTTSSTTSSSTTSSTTSTSTTSTTSSSTTSTSPTTSTTTSLCTQPNCTEFLGGWNLISLALTP